jgi:alkylated DNA repair dioxygenase AlkB
MNGAFLINTKSMIYINDKFLSANLSDKLLNFLVSNISWQQGVEPRETAYFGPDYTYSGLSKKQIQECPPILNDLQRIVNETFKLNTNSILLNHYKNGQHSVGWHSDNEPELGLNPTIVSVSLGQSRDLLFKEKSSNFKDHNEHLFSVKNTHGMVLIMGGETQSHFLHCVPKIADQNHANSRINITMRLVTDANYKNPNFIFYKSFRSNINAISRNKLQAKDRLATKACNLILNYPPIPKITLSDGRPS